MVKPGTVNGREVLSFGLVGAIAYVVDVGIFNLLVHASIAPLATHPVSGKIISSAVATLVAYFGNRNLTWRGLSTHSIRHEITLFFIFNGIALAIAGLALATSRYVLGLDSVLADNVSANIIGVGLGTVFRFWSYRKWVFQTAGNNS